MIALLVLAVNSLGSSLRGQSCHGWSASGKARGGANLEKEAAALLSSPILTEKSLSEKLTRNIPRPPVSRHNT